MKVIRILTSAILLVASVNSVTNSSADPLAATISPSQPLINIDFGSGGARGYSLKTGFAAMGQATNDFWNFYDRDASPTPNVWRYSGALTNLQLASAGSTTVGLSVSDAPGAWNDASGDPMYATYDYPLDGGNNVVTFTNLSPGQYDVLAYSPDGNYEVTVGGTSYGVKTTYDSPVSTVPAWTEGLQYARWRNVTVGAGQPLILTVRNGVGGYAILSGMQILSDQPAQANCTPPPTNLVSWWPAEGNANDVAGGNNGNLSNGVAFVAGVVGQAFSFNGSNSYVQVPDSATLRLTNTLTVEFWVKRQQITGRPYGDIIVEKGGDWTGGVENYGVGFGSAGYGNVFTFFFAGGNRGAGAINDLNWHHCAIVAHNGDADATFYLDGVLQPVTQRQGAATINLYPSTRPLHIGAQIDPNYVYYSDTLVDEVSLYNRALSASEIQAIYQAGAAGKCFTPTAPVIIAQPASQTNLVGTTASFSVLASGTPPLSYQWSLNTTNLAGATNVTLTLTNVQLSNAGNYSVVVTNLYGSVTSSNATLTVTTPVCTPPPTNLVSWWPAEGNANDVAGGNNGTLQNGAGFVTGEVGQAFALNGNLQSVTVGNPANLQLQNFTIEAWIQRANTSFVSQGSAGYGVVFGYGFGGYGLIFDSAGHPILSKIGVNGTQINTAISDTHFHHLAVTKSGSTVVFYIDGTAYAAPAYSQTFAFSTVAAIGARGDNLDNSFAGLIDEVSVYNRALSANEIQAIYNAGSAGKCFTPAPPAIVTQPASQSVVAGDSAMFAVVANGTPPLSYQWFFNGNNISGATNSTLVLPNTQLTNAGIYSVLVGNTVNAIWSSNAMLTVTTPVCTPPPTNLVSWWPAEGNANDAASTNNGILQNNVAFAAGKVGQAFSFNGSNSYVQVPDSATLRLTNTLTIECWVKRQQITGRPYGDIIVEKGGDWTGGVENYGVGIAPAVYGNLFQFFFADGNRGCGNVNDLNWHHCAVVAHNGDVDPIFYLDGVQQPVTWRQGATTINLYPSTRPLHIGAQIDPNYVYYSDALVDELSIYNRALSATEIQAIYAARGAGKCPLPPTVISVTPTSWYVNEGSTVTFTATAVGSPTLAYQWQYNGSDLTNAINATLTLTNVVYAQAGNYAVVVSNPGGLTTSSNVLLRVNRAPIADASATETVAISPNDSNAVVVLDGSRSSDPDGDALTYAWFHAGDASLFAAGIVAIETLPVGTNQLTLTVNDGLASGSQTFAVEVITTSQAVDRLIAMVQSGSGHPRPLIASLRAALAAIDRSHPIVAILQLEAFIHKVQAQLQPSDPVLAAQLIADAQAIIDALNGGGTVTVGPVQITSFGHGPDGKAHLKIKGIAGRIHVVETSTNMVDWVPVGVASQSSDGDYEFDDSQTPASGALFYRVVAPK